MQGLNARSNAETSVLRSGTQWWHLLIVVVLFLVGVQGVLIPLLGPDLSRTPGDTGDARFNLYVLEHFHAWATGRVENYWDAPFLFPSANAMARSDTHLGTAWIHSLLRFFGAGPSGAFQGWIIALFTLNFWCCVIAFRAWTGRWAIAGCAAYLYTFGILPLSQLDDLQALPRFMAPLALYALHRALSSFSPRWAFAAVLGSVLQFYCATHLGLILLFAFLCLVIGHGIGVGIRSDRRTRIAWSASVSVGVLLLMPLLLHQVPMEAEVASDDREMIARTIPRLGSYVHAHPSAISWASLHGPEMSMLPSAAQQHHFPGALAWLGVLIALPWWWRLRRTPDGRSLGVVLIAWLVSMLIPLSIGGFSLVGALPGLHIRSGGHFVLIDQLFFLLVGTTLVTVTAKSLRVSNALAIVLPLLVWLDNKADVTAIVRFDRNIADRGVDQVEADIRSEIQPGVAAVAYAPVWGCRKEELRRTELIELHMQAMLAAQRIGVPVVNGYSGSLPAALQPFWNDPGPSTLERWLAANPVQGTVELVDGLPAAPLSRDTVIIGTQRGVYVGVGQWPEDPLTTDRKEAHEWETFIRLRFADGTWAFVAHHNGFLSAELHHGAVVAAGAHRLGDMGLFRPQPTLDGRFLLQAQNGAYLELKDGGVSASADSTSATPFTIGPARSTGHER